MRDDLALGGLDEGPLPDGMASLESSLSLLTAIAFPPVCRGGRRGAAALGGAAIPLDLYRQARTLGGELVVSAQRAALDALAIAGDDLRGAPGVGQPPAPQVELGQPVGRLVGDGDEAPDGGLGVGLSLVQQLVSRHDGEVSAYSTGEPGRGAEFVIRLPLIEPPTA